ncbi:MAG: SpoIIE family protein phosphatase [Brevirhabdus sp.]
MSNPNKYTGPAGDICILVVDDSKVQRKILIAGLKQTGYRVLEACSGEEALSICENESIDIVLSDWMMPGMNGLEFCRAFRSMKRESYGYFILLTSKSEKAEVTLGLEAGADDFLTKPVNAAELRARIKSGERILWMERELIERNRLTELTLRQISDLHEAIERDLEEARKLQKALVSTPEQTFGEARVSLLLESSGHVGGDLVGAFRIDQSRVVLYAIDVSGHGISSALMTARLAGNLSGNLPEQNIGITRDSSGGLKARSPESTVRRLNEMVLSEMDTEHYLTIVYAVIDVETGSGRMCQAGHPHPAIQRANGSVEFIGQGGMPVGLIQGAEYAGVDFHLDVGDRLLITSDGVTECADPSGSMMEDEGLADFLVATIDSHGRDLFSELLNALKSFGEREDFSDDVSAVLFEFGALDAKLCSAA